MKANIDTRGITHAIILVCAGDGNLSEYVQENLDGIEQYFRDFRLSSRKSPKASKGPPTFGVLALSDFYSRDAEIHWYSPSCVSKHKIGEINTGDALGIAEFLAGGLTLLDEVEHLAIGFSGHGTGVLNERRPSRVQPEGLRSSVLVYESTQDKVPAFADRLARVGDDDDSVTDVETLENIAEHLPPHVSFGQPTENPGNVAPKDWLTTLEVVKALKDAFTHSKRTPKVDKVDLLFFDSCFNGMIEVAYQCRDYANAFVGSMNAAPRTLWDYRIWLKWMEATPPTDGYVWAGLALRAFQEAARLPVESRLPDNASHTWALTAVRTDHQLDQVVQAFGQLVGVLSDLEEKEEPSELKEDKEERPKLKDIVMGSLYAAQKYSGESIRGIVDFAHQLGLQVRVYGQAEEAIEEIQRACRALEDSVSQALVSPAPMVVIEPGRVALDARRVHGLAFWGPSYWGAFQPDSENYECLDFASPAGWYSYLKAALKPKEG